MTTNPRKREDTAEGCRLLASESRELAAAATNGHMRVSLERSASVWSARADLLTRLEANFTQRALAARAAGEKGASADLG